MVDRLDRLDRGVFESRPKQIIVNHTPFRKVLFILIGALVTMLSIGNVNGQGVENIYTAVAFSYFFLTLSLLTLICFYFRFRLINLLQPSVVGIVYLGLSMSFGAWFFQSSNALSSDWLDLFYANIQNLGAVFTLISTCFFAIFVASLTSCKIPTFIQPDEPPRHSLLIYIAAAVIGIIAIFIDRFAGGSFSILKISLTSAFISLVFLSNVRFKWSLVALLIVLLAAVSFDSKREAIFVILCLMVIWCATRTNKRLSINKVLLLLPVTVSVVILILAMSILRGYGGYNSAGFIEAIQSVPDYITQDYFLSSVGNNFELTSTFFHVTYSTDAVLQNPSLMTHGETYLRVFFLGPIGEFLGYKPHSILESYTLAMFPRFRAIGGSYPITSIGEAIWNFSYFAPIALFILYFTFDKIFAGGLKLIQKKKVFGTIIFLVFVELMMFYSRGSGVDLVFAYFLVSVFGTFVLAPFVKVSLNKFGIDRQNYANLGQGLYK